MIGEIVFSSWVALIAVMFPVASFSFTAGWIVKNEFEIRRRANGYVIDLTSPKR